MPYRRVFDVVWSGRRHIMMMASQVDRFGNQNLSAIGDWARPKAQLIGVRGAPGNSLNHTDELLGPRPHDAQLRRARRHGVRRRLRPRRGGRVLGARASTMSASSCRTSASSTSTPPTTPCGSARCTPAWRLEEVVDATGFELVVPDPVPTTPLPTAEELELIREVLDPDPAARQGDPVLTPDVGLPDPHPALHTSLCDLAGVRYPIVQTGMGWVAGPRLVAATANAGALGILASATMTVDELRAAIAEVKARTDAPFGVNLRTDAPDSAERIALLVDAGVKVASFAQAPRPDMVAALRDAGVVVIPTVGARRHAEKVAEWGVHGVIAQGAEGGGHTGLVPTSLLLPQVCDAVGDRVAVIGAGGFSSGRGLVAALAYGAAGHRHGDALSPHPREHGAR